jgi:hypothetical protein
MACSHLRKQLRAKNGALALLIDATTPQIPPRVGQNVTVGHGRIFTCR